jgi:hypothetical protein
MTNDGNPARLVAGQLFIKGTAELQQQVEAELTHSDPTKKQAEAILSSGSEHEDTNNNDRSRSSCDDDESCRQDCS